MDHPPYAFREANRWRIEELAARRSPRPMAEPLYGAMIVGFIAGLVGMMTLWFGGAPDLTDHRLESIATLVSLIVGGIAYVLLRAQRRDFYDAVERVTGELWAEHTASAQLGDSAP